MLKKLVEITEQLIDIIPDEYKGNLKFLKGEFKKTQECYYDDCRSILYFFLLKIIGPIPVEEWHIKAWSLFNEKSEDEIRKFAEKLKQEDVIITDEE